MPNNSGTGKSSVSGDVARIDIGDDDSERPYRITLVGHRFCYEVALIDGSDPPALSDIRLVAVTPGTPVERRDLVTAGNVVDRLAAIAAGKADEPHLNRRIAEDMRVDFAERFGVDAGDITVRSWNAPGPVLIPAPPKRGRGRPAKTTEFYRRVANAAYDAEADPMRTLTAGVAERIARWPESNGKLPPEGTVNDWLRKARKLGLYQGKRARSTETPDQASPSKETDE